MRLPEINIIEHSPNERGDLFTRLMEAYFSTLGYGRFLFNVGKAGREVDLQGRHITEDRYMVAECKATVSPVGGDEVNKFVGALGVERNRHDPSLTIGYFVSL